MVELQKDTVEGVGITIVGGENTGKLDLGIFVRSVTPGGPADQDGRVHPGDRIIAINGQSLEGIPHHKAVDMIRESPPLVQLLLSQPQSSAISHLRQRLDHEDEEEGLSVDGMNVETMSIPTKQRRQSIGSSDLELEDVVPREALSPRYAHQHMTTPVHGTDNQQERGQSRLHHPSKLLSNIWL